MTKPITSALIGAAVLIALFFVLKHSGFDTERSGEIVIGLSLAFYANFIPKNVASVRGPHRQAALRFSGYAFALSGLGFAAAWAFLPEAQAFPAAMTMVGSAVVLSAGYTLWACTKHASS